MGNKQLSSSNNINDVKIDKHFDILIAGYIRTNSKLFVPKSVQVLIINFYNTLTFNSSIQLKAGNKINLPNCIITISKNVTISCDKWTITDNNNNATDSGGIIHIICDSLINNGTIDASGTGWYGQSGKGSGCYFATSSRLPDMSGGSYGKLASSCGDIYAMDSSLYGDAKLSKVYYGSGIAQFNDRSGGGIIIIQCNTYFENNGKIKCNGDSGCSGGSILIIAKSFNNKFGSIRAVGGAGLRQSKEFFCSGGVGRIAIYSDNGKFVNSAPEPYLGKHRDGSFEICVN
eukprot:104036_1